MNPVVKLYTVEVKRPKEQKEGILSFILTAKGKERDRDGDIVEPTGAIIDNFIKNPVFLWAHDLRFPPIGKVLPETIVISRNKITADVEFDLDDPFAAAVYRKYKNKYLNAGSIRFLPKEYEFIKDEEGDRIIGVHYKKWELLEFSAVPVPANQYALRTGKEIEEQKDKADEAIEQIISKLPEPTCEAWVKSIGGVPEFEKELEQEQKTIEDALEQAKQIADEIKEGRVLSEKNFKRLQEAVQILKEVLDSAQRQQSGEELEDEEKGVVPFAATTPADEGRSWDANEAIKRIKRWAAGDGEFDLENSTVRGKFKRAFAYFEGDGTRQGDYKLPHHDIVDGQLVVVWRGVAAAMAALLGARGGVNIPDSARKGVYNHLVKHYKQFDKNPPDFKSLESLDDQEQFYLELILQDKELTQQLVDQVVENLMEENNRV